MTKEITVKRSEETTLDPDFSKSSATAEHVKDDCDWQEAFKYAHEVSNPVTRETIKYENPIEEVAYVVAISEGSNDGPEWVGIFLMKDGKFLFLAAGCDYSGWGCQASGHAEWHNSLKTLWSCITVDDHRERLSKDLDLGFE